MQQIKRSVCFVMAECPFELNYGYLQYTDSACRVQMLSCRTPQAKMFLRNIIIVGWKWESVLQFLFFFIPSKLHTHTQKKT